MIDLYRRTKRLPEPHALPPNAKRDRDIRTLNSFRNTFVHFVPQGVSVEVSGMPRITRHCLDVIAHLSLAHPNVLATARWCSA